MTMPATPSNPKSADSAVVHPVDSFAEKLHKLWAQNRSAVLTACALVLLAIVGKGGYEAYTSYRDGVIKQDYKTAEAAKVPEKLQAFAESHAGHALAGVAWLTLADDAFTAGNYAAAATNYDKAVAALKDEVPMGRAKLGAAMARLLSGKTAEGEAALKQIADDPRQLKGLRAEAAFHLASLAAEAGRIEDVKKYSDQVMQIDGMGMMAQRAMLLRANAAATEPASAAPAATPASAVSIKVPGKS